VYMIQSVDGLSITDSEAPQQCCFRLTVGFIFCFRSGRSKTSKF